MPSGNLNIINRDKCRIPFYILGISFAILILYEATSGFAARIEIFVNNISKCTGESAGAVVLRVGVSFDVDHPGFTIRLISFGKFGLHLRPDFDTASTGYLAIVVFGRLESDEDVVGHRDEVILVRRCLDDLDIA